MADINRNLFFTIKDWQPFELARNPTCVGFLDLRWVNINNCSDTKKETCQAEKGRSRQQTSLASGALTLHFTRLLLPPRIFVDKTITDINAFPPCRPLSLLLRRHIRCITQSPCCLYLLSYHASKDGRRGPLFHQATHPALPTEL